MTDNVNHPAHYVGFSNGAEVIDITENLSFNLGNVVKYVARAGRKTEDPTEDLLKAEFYLSREIKRLLTSKPEPVEWSLEGVSEELDRLNVQRTRRDLNYTFVINDVWKPGVGYEAEWESLLDIPSWVDKVYDKDGDWWTGFDIEQERANLNTETGKPYIDQYGPFTLEKPK